MGLFHPSRVRRLIVTGPERLRHTKKRTTYFMVIVMTGFFCFVVFRGQTRCPGLDFVFVSLEGRYQGCKTREGDRQTVQGFSRQPSSCLRQGECGLVAQICEQTYPQSTLSTSDSVQGSSQSTQARRKRQSVLHNGTKRFLLLLNPLTLYSARHCSLHLYQSGLVWHIFFSSAMSAFEITQPLQAAIN